MTAYREYSEKSKTKRDEVLAKCTGQINEVLTEKDRASLKKIEDAVQKKADADQKARDAWVKTQEDSLKAFEKEMEQVLTDEQKAKLKTSALAPRMPGPGPISIGPK
jgi:arginyl-tRNA synthetase